MLAKVSILIIFIANAEIDPASDMADRIGMRGSVMTQFGWMEPTGERPDWRVWRTNLEKLKLPLDNRTSYESTESTGPRVEFCRSMRGFVAWKS